MDRFRVNSLFLSLTVIILCSYECSGAYVPPYAKVEPLYPKGIRISIPDENGISLVAFHVNFNVDFDGLEAGTIARDVLKVRNGVWKYEDRTTELKRGDVVYYWVHVVYKGLGYNLLDQQHRVTDFYNPDGTVAVLEEPEEPEQTCVSTSETSWIAGKYGEQNHPCPRQLIFSEDFNELDGNRWTSLEQFSGPPDYEFVVYRNSPNNLKIKNGDLVILPDFLDNSFGEGFSQRGSLTLQGCTGRSGTADCRREAVGSYILPPIISARVNTKNSFAFRYGKVQVRAKLPRGDWVYPLITLEAIDNNEGDSRTYSQLRVASSSGNTVLKNENDVDISGHILWAGGLTVEIPNHPQSMYGNRSSLPRRYSSSLWSDDFHVYELEWAPNRIVVRVDGVNYGEQECASPFDKYYHLNIGVAAGGHSEFPDPCTSNGYAKPWRNVASKALYDFYCARDRWTNSWQERPYLQVDYVKVWAL